ncbi:hypothetical protein H4R35_007091, partial [Dimargaris xerosporica]
MKVTIVVGILGALALCSHQATAKPMDQIPDAKSYQSTDTDELVGHEARQRAEEITQAYQTALSKSQASAAVNLIHMTLADLIQGAHLDLPIRSDYFDMLQTHLENFTD